MAATSIPQGDWQRLGDLLISRRVELGYQERSAWCKATGLNYKTVTDIELAKRSNFGPQMLAKIELAYQWEPGSIKRVLQGGPPVPRRTEERDADRYPEGVGGDPFLEYIWDYPEASDLERRTAVRAVQELRRAALDAAREALETGVIRLRQAE
ncbi:hypothetical protein [Thermomonospora cellulosilytica]|uniref:Uncharacterized protein n=1 Tax=Thermomonospora cellulosilytica TaxID=1411118 RepID=A0A7W3RAN1_9ACTN|nr:hypothetical protein [Thermomonospora cellulosilytica]MBA9006016.1 hypothetical protein [Thermomonospora cellulosilytica]